MKHKSGIVLGPGFSSLLLESMADGVFTLNDRGEFTSWNPAMERITGYYVEEAIGQPCTLLNFSLCFQKRSPRSVQECGIMQHGRLDGKECFLRHKDGHDVPVLKSARLVHDSKGAVKGIVETVTDLTELEKYRREAEEAKKKLGKIYQFNSIIGKSPAMQHVFSSIKAAASSDATILLQGESGTGKELVAGAIHHNSARSGMPFVSLGCSALSESLLESELFGHIRGSFTGAIRDRIGRFEEAEGGTIFLDEIGEISPYMQVKLLRVLQEREIERVGESKKRKVDIRIIAATNKDLFYLVKKGDFREDLYYRLKVFPIFLPPLRKRREDIPLLISHFIRIQNRKTRKHIRDVSKSSMRILMDYNWPGNVRELENAIEHAFVLCSEPYIDIFDLPIEMRQLAYSPAFPDMPASSAPKPIQKKKITRERLIENLKQCGWNKAEAGRRMNLSRTSIWKYMKKWDIPLNESAE
ncbi:MAG TPA: sigma 54-interacting transcriptional regulator [Desulfobacteraceae bacterium]|nr:sigma 54-interacting transcriptional regulator [Desulfobacteraceae bacterium]